MIKYPVVVAMKGKSRTIRNANELVDKYDSIFTAKYIASIKEAVPHNMFARYDGVKFGASGEVWFDSTGKVKTLNN